ncbi:uncharacterized protein LOC114728035 [Neltuma alba]|uniref:uncharacterized protein LOC114726886 n=1 Tax=Neltuma alba TaxID=207710 RepID=UPI0010A34ECE|nr:uncharacterized protein LOC114726886 [Prosopis alba]XP_028769436.1 uncharacterized protein LOC114726886 [Prosopis alba]XP_028769437.1 uncharacterized protein LOC114726886 [Prosopis alba]XP_028770685.1 uncharacterized protein LOC114728035 [Prosopis alba]XP_028770692.1 uncharacterized protein LOC114728035 [Prosopis alba]XP_028770699.1 uncharacterized protein LOC114728035 [Prosopis alba]
MIPDTADPSYWLNWRFLLCAICILASLVLGLFLIWKYEGVKRSRRQGRENQQETDGSLYNDEAWKTCLKGLHPAWLLAYRLIAFLALLGLLIADVVFHGGHIFYFYTQWTFSLVVIYFGLGSSLSIYGCCVSDKSGPIMPNGNTASTLGVGVDMSNLLKNPNALQVPHAREAAGVWVYAFQIIYQMCAGAVALTDCVFWLVLYPLLNDKAIALNFLIVCMHSVNAVFLLGDMALNCLRFPMFRFGYFVLWTCTFVIFQWVFHMFVSTSWPYPFLELSSPYAPLWYLAVGVLHIPCYCAFALVVKLKNLWLSRSFPGSSQIVR